MMKCYVHKMFFIVDMFPGCLLILEKYKDLNKIHKECNCVELFTALLGVHFCVTFQ